MQEVTPLGTTVPVAAADLLRELQVAVRECAGKLDCAYLFGSVARGEAGPLSDCDVALLFRESLPPHARLETAAAIIDQVQRIDGTRIDVVILNEAPPALRHRVIRDGRPLFVADDTRRVRFEHQTLREFLDFRWVLDRYDEVLLKRAREGHLGHR